MNVTALGMYTKGVIPQVANPKGLSGQYSSTSSNLADSFQKLKNGNKDALSFQATGVFLKGVRYGYKELIIKEMNKAGNKLHQKLKEITPSASVWLDDTFSPVGFALLFKTDSESDHIVIPMLEKYAKENNFKSEIQPGTDNNAVVWELMERANNLYFSL